jgi:hypothetical protein
MNNIFRPAQVVSARILIESEIAKILEPARKHKDNKVVDNAMTVVRWINDQNSQNNRSSVHYVIELRDSIISEDTGLSEKQVQSVKSLLKKKGIIKFWKKARWSSGAWLNLWNFSVLYSRLVVVIQETVGERVIKYAHRTKLGLKWLKKVNLKENIIDDRYKGVLLREEREAKSGIIRSVIKRAENRLAKQRQQKIFDEFDVDFAIDF